MIDLPFCKLNKFELKINRFVKTIANPNLKAKPSIIKFYMNSIHDFILSSKLYFIFSLMLSDLNKTHFYPFLEFLNKICFKLFYLLFFIIDLFLRHAIFFF